MQVKNFCKLFFICAIIVAKSVYLYSQWLDPQWKKSIILFEVQKGSDDFIAIGTGFLIKYHDKDFIVTNKHISNNDQLFIRFNTKDNSITSLRFSIKDILEQGEIEWKVSKECDIAVIPLKIKIPNSIIDQIDIRSFSISLIKDWEYINEGDDVYILGFPLRIGTGDQFSPVVRSGIIALKNKPGEFLVDANIFPGNSGGPVFLKSNIFDYRSKNLGKSTPGYLIGIVSSYISYTDVAISSQTKRPRITFEENSGLANVYSSDQIIKLIEGQ